MLGYLLTHAHTHTLERGGGSGLVCSGLVTIAACDFAVASQPASPEQIAA
jgi:hypothetical protein